MMWSRKKGVTLLEVLIAISMMGVVTTIGVRSFVLLTDSWREASAAKDLEEQADQALGMLALDFYDVLSSELSGASITGIDREIASKGFNQAPNARDQLVIPIRGTMQSLSPKAALVMYEVQESRNDAGGRSHLVRTLEWLSKTGDPEQDRPVTGTLIDRADVIRFNVEFGTGDVDRPWANEWSSVNRPRSIRVSLTVADPDFPYRQVSRKKTYSVLVR
jgi:prepilin-type N-terminal cleavage/methylation domain-containing protein